MAEKYVLQLGIADTKEPWSRVEVVDSEDLPMRLGEHELMVIVHRDARGAKRITVTVKVEKL